MVEGQSFRRFRTNQMYQSALCREEERSRMSLAAEMQVFRWGDRISYGHAPVFGYSNSTRITPGFPSPTTRYAKDHAANQMMSCAFVFRLQPKREISRVCCLVHVFCSALSYLLYVSPSFSLAGHCYNILLPQGDHGRERSYGVHRRCRPVDGGAPSGTLGDGSTMEYALCLGSNYGYGTIA